MPCPLAVSPTYLQAYLDEYSLDLVDYRFARPGVANGTVDANQTLYQGVQEQWHQGLSPRVRGNQPHHVPGAVCLASIPACAGEPVSGMPTRVVIEVYPRVCGGTFPACLRQGLALGLSPRVRGNRQRAGKKGLSYVGCPWSIPACAGEPFKCCCRHRGRHHGLSPRVRGNRQLSTPVDLRSSGDYTATGLSPRVRGNPPGLIV